MSPSDRTTPTPRPGRTTGSSPLRLVRESDDALLPPARPRPGEAPRGRSGETDAQRRSKVAFENRVSAALSDDDARAIFACRVAEVLEGGRAAILAPERRDRLLKLATMIGLRPFDATLIIAIVQDRARGGDEAPHRAPAVMLVGAKSGSGGRGDAPFRTAHRALLWRFVWAILLGAAWLGVLIWWLG